MTYQTKKPPLAQELHDIVENDRYPFAARIRTLRAILGKLKPEPIREPLPPQMVYAPPRAKVSPSQGRQRAGAPQYFRCQLALPSSRKM